MQNNSRSYPSILFKSALVLLLASIPFSRALLSISTGLIVISAIWEFILNKPKVHFKNKYLYCLAGLVIFCLLDGFRADSHIEWARLVELKLPLLLLPLSILIFNKHLNERLITNFTIVFCMSVSAATLGSIINYGMNYKAINALVLQSKNVPIMGGMHHITFSVFCAFASLVSFVLAVKLKSALFWLLAVVNLLGLHILTARTGLVGFYFAAFILGIVYLVHHRPKTHYLVGVGLAIIIAPLVAFWGIGSFHNRVLNTWEDIKVIRAQKDVNYQSMGMRLEASKTAISIAKKHPIIGVGFSNIKGEMARQYTEDNSTLFLENRIMPHNQFIMEATVHGIIGFVILLLYFAFPLFAPFTKLPLVFLCLWSLLFFASFFECLFDRQHGILLVSLFWFLYIDFKPEGVKNK